MTRRKFIAGNWKMHKSIAEAAQFAAALRDRVGALPCDLAIIPPFLAVAAVAERLRGSGVEVGAQDVFWEREGAYTGEVSPSMILDAGASVVLVGHSERRHVMGEDDRVVARKLASAVAAGLTAILCVGEQIDDRQAGGHMALVDRQLEEALGARTPLEMERIVIAYEPVWAIGTGHTATPDDAEEMHRHIRSRIAVKFGAEVAARLRIQYGGSVKPANAGDLLARGDIDGALVGGASLEVESFLQIARSCAAL